jgi:hypothetical protein
MHTILKQLNRWSEAWSLLLPLAIYLIYRVKNKSITPLIIYLIIALPLSILSIVIAVYNYKMPDYFKNNNLLINIHSFARVIFWGLYIIRLNQVKRYPFAKILFYIYIVLVVLDFTLFENPLFYSVRLFSAESIVLFMLCITFFLSSILDEDEHITLKHPAFLVCIGISIYEAISFFIYLFLYPLFFTNPAFGYLTMKISSYSFILLCILIAIAVYQSKRQIPR